MVDPADLNGSKWLFGGRLLSWIDTVAGVTARRHCEMNAITASIDNLNFLAPAHRNELLVLVGKVTYTGRTSMEVCVKTYIENIDGTRTLINKGYVVLVAHDENSRPAEVPRLRPETEEEKAEFSAGEKRRALRAQRKAENY